MIKLSPEWNLTPFLWKHSEFFAQRYYLCPQAGSDEGGSAGGAPPAAHGVPDSFIQFARRQDSV